MNKTVVVLLAVAAVVGVGYVYYTTTSEPKQGIKNIGAKGKKAAPSFANNGIQLGNKSGINANVNLPGEAGNWAGLINGIFHPTDGNAATVTAASQTSTSTTSASTS